MIVTIKSKIPVELDAEDILIKADIYDGDSLSTIRYKIMKYIDSALGVPDDMETNTVDLADLLSEEVKDLLSYYIVN